MKLIVVCGRLPYPPNSGGLLDTFSRLAALRDSGVELLVVVAKGAKESPVAPELIAEFEQQAGKVLFVEIRSDPTARLNQWTSIWKRPPLLLRWAKEAEHALLLEAAEFRADAIWLDYLMSAPIASALQARLKLPLFVRSHNVEHRYRKIVARQQPSLVKRALLQLQTFGLRKFELNLLRSAHAVYDISVDDVRYWQDLGLRNVRWMPTFIRNKPAMIPAPRADLSFLGSLSLPTNLEGLLWFLGQVLPIIRAKRPGTKVVIGGSGPSQATRAWLSGFPDVELIANAASPSDVWATGAVLINPVLSGSGVNVKSIEMLFYDRPLVTTSVGVRGLPEEVRHSFLIGDTPASFADQVLGCLQTAFVPVDHELSRKYFDRRASESLVRSLEADLQRVT